MTPHDSTITPEAALALVEHYGQVDEAARHSGMSVKAFRALCKANGISARGTAKTPDYVLEAGIPAEVLLEQEVKELRRQVKALSEIAVRDQRIIEHVSERISALSPRYKPAAKDTKRNQTPHEFLLLWSDLHAGEVVFPEQVHGVNEYTWEIMLARHDKLTNSILSFRDHRPYPVTALRIAALGDMVGGDIHEELKETNEKVVTDACLQLAADMAVWIESLVPEFERITIDGVVGNHGRLTKKPPMKNQHANWDYVFYHVLALYLRKYESVTVTAPKAAFHAMQVFDKNLLLWHGDGVRSSMPGVPWGGVLRRSKELDKQFSHLGRIDHHLLGHWHNPNAVDDFRILINGSVKGPDEYALKSFGGGTPPMQILVPFHPKRGLVEITRCDLIHD